MLQTRVRYSDYPLYAKNILDIEIFQISDFRESVQYSRFVVDHQDEIGRLRFKENNLHSSMLPSTVNTIVKQMSFCRDFAIPFSFD